MLEDQKHVLSQMVELVKEKEVQVFIIAGDVYDRAIPTAEAVCVFDDFIENFLNKKTFSLINPNKANVSSTVVK